MAKSSGRAVHQFFELRPATRQLEHRDISWVRFLERDLVEDAAGDAIVPRGIARMD
jgi:hypothetical protein